MQPALDFFSWFKGGFSSGTLITMLTVAGGFAVTHGREQQRMDDLERRIAIFETSGVKRSEFDARDGAIVDRLTSIDGRLEVIERALIEQRNRN